VTCIGNLWVKIFNKSLIKLRYLANSFDLSGNASLWAIITSIGVEQLIAFRERGYDGEPSCSEATFDYLPIIWDIL
jgi:hypothetical protein